MSARFPFLQEQKKGKAAAFSLLVLIALGESSFKSFTSWTLIWNGRKRSQYRALEKTEF